MLKHIIFDFDGTIADSLDQSLKIGNQLASKYGFRELTKTDLRELSSLPIEERLKRYNIKLYYLPKLLFEFLKIYRNHISSIEMVSGMDSLLENLKSRGLKLGIISSNNVENINKFLSDKKLLAFDFIYSSKGLFGKHATIKSCMSKYGINKDEVIYVGDELRDIAACKITGVRIVSVSWGFDPPELLLKGEPDFMANTPDELLNHILSLG